MDRSRRKTDLDYESAISYTVTLQVRDGKDAEGNDDTSIDDAITVTISVNNVDEPRLVSFSDTPEVNETFVASLTDPDGGVTGETWQWQRTSDGGIWEDIYGATGQVLVPGPQDAGKRLRLSVIYDHAFAAGVVLISAPTGIVINANPTPTPVITFTVMPTLLATPVTAAHESTPVATGTAPTPKPQRAAVAPFPTIVPTPPADPGLTPSLAPGSSPSAPDLTNVVSAAVDRFLGLPAGVLAGIVVGGALLLGTAGVGTWRIVRGRSAGASSPDTGDGPEAGSEM